MNLHFHYFLGYLEYYQFFFTNLVTTIWNWIKNGQTLGSIEVIFMWYVVHTVDVYFIVDSSN